MAVGANCSGDAPEIEWPLVTSAELPTVAIDSPCTGTSIATLMTPVAASPVEDSEIETSVSVVSSSLLRLQKIEADLRLVVTDTVTCVGRSDERTDSVVVRLKSQTYR
ncbi:unnamed protein product [Macrosiphum euphorbiae]|uniref:Uncharacterized protein n=1 Tax=Macrosiphum euphorbiae TaxID=13131 RepID=A0AAV0X5C0_9HEMI|nr:unnamed protein product [Macrosiphum euphorbiae]